MKVGVVLDEGDVLLVQFTSSFALFLGWHLVVCRNTPSVPHTLLAALGESNRFTTYPLSCLFSRIAKYDERRGAKFSSAQKTAKVWNSKSIKNSILGIVKPCGCWPRSLCHVILLNGNFTLFEPVANMVIQFLSTSWLVDLFRRNQLGNGR